MFHKINTLTQQLTNKATAEIYKRKQNNNWGMLIEKVTINETELSTTKPILILNVLIVPYFPEAVVA